MTVGAFQLAPEESGLIVVRSPGFHASPGLFSFSLNQCLRKRACVAGTPRCFRNGFCSLAVLTVRSLEGRRDIEFQRKTLDTSHPAPAWNRRIFFVWANSQVLSVRCLARQPLDKKYACGKTPELPKIDRPCLKNGFEN